MTRTAYYEELKALARSVRAKHSLVSPRVQLTDLRRIYREERVQIELWPPDGGSRLRHLRGAYLDDGPQEPWVMVSRHLPMEQRVFTLAHELKHHLRDRGRGALYCLGERGEDEIEIGAEIFAAELIYPELDFARDLSSLGIRYGRCTPEAIVRIKSVTATTLSYTSLAKRAEFLGAAPRGSLQAIKWKKLAEQILGEPIYKRIQRARARRADALYKWPMRAKSS